MEEKMEGKKGKLTAALIGCGGMGTTHNLALKALSEEMQVEVVALADCREEFLNKNAAHWPEARTYQTGMELLEKETPDIVHICLPSYLHAQHAEAAMRKGCSVFIEKPVCLTRQEAASLLKIQEETNARVMVGQVVRSFPEYRYLRKAYQEGTFGRLKSIMMQRLSGKVSWGFENWFLDEKKSGSVILDLHIHDLDFLRYMLGEPDSFDVKATAFETGMINQVIATYQFGNVFATAEGIWDVSPSLGFRPSYRACFEEGTVVFDGTVAPAVTVYTRTGEVFHPQLEEDVKMHDTSAGINISDLGPYYTEIRYFLNCLREGSEIRRAPLSEGIRSVLLGLDELDAAREYVKKTVGEEKA